LGREFVATTIGCRAGKSFHFYAGIPFSIYQYAFLLEAIHGKNKAVQSLINADTKCA